MKKTIKFVSFLVIVLFVLMPVVYAEQNTESMEKQATKAAAKVTLEEMRAENKATREALREQRKEVRQEITEDRLTLIAQFTIRKLEAAIFRCENIIERFASRLKKIGEKRDVTAATTQLNLAKTSLAKAKASLTKAKEIVDSLAESEDLKTLFSTFRDQVKEVKTYLMETHKALKMGIVGFKEPTPTIKTTPAVTITKTVTLTPALVVSPAITEGVSIP